MEISTTQSEGDKSKSAANRVSKKSKKPLFNMIDNGPEAVAQRKLQNVINNSVQVNKINNFAKLAQGQTQNYTVHQLQLKNGKVKSVNKPTVQRTPIGAGGHEYGARNPSQHFFNNHTGDAEEVSLNRAIGGRGLINTVINESADTLNARVLASDWDNAVHLYGNVYGVDVEAAHQIVTCQEGGQGRRVSNVGAEVVGTVRLKVYFDSDNSTISITGVTD